MILVVIFIGGGISFLSLCCISYIFITRNYYKDLYDCISGHNVRRRNRVIPIIKPIKEIEMTVQHNYVVVRSPDNKISIGIEHIPPLSI